MLIGFILGERQSGMTPEQPSFIVNSLTASGMQVASSQNHGFFGVAYPVRVRLSQLSLVLGFGQSRLVSFVLALRVGGIS